jgi:hypothetical protein
VAGPRVVVDGPSFTTLPYGLWETAQKPTSVDSHWQNGITWVDRCGGGDTLYEECIAVTGVGGPPASGQASMVSNITQTNRGATSFAVYAEFDCSPVGLADAQGLAERELARVRDYQLEKAFWTGVAGKTSSGSVAQTTVFPHLAASAVITDPNASTITLQTAATQSVTGSGGPDSDVANALGALESSLANCYHGQGVIHVPSVALPTLAAWDLVEPDGNGGLLTTAGNRVIVGQGYTGSGPSTPGTAPSVGTCWIYATGAVFGYSSPVKVPSLTEMFDRTENTYRLLAQQVYVIGFECCHFAAFINLGVPTSPTI